MPDLNIPNEFKVDSSSKYSNIPQTDTSSPLPASASSGEDQLSSTQSLSEIKKLYPSIAIKNESEIPSLISPKITEYSLSEFLKIIGNASLDLREQFQANQRVDIHLKTERSKIIADMVMDVRELEEARAEALEQLPEVTQADVDELQELFDPIQTEMDAQKKRVDELNAGRAEEREACVEIVTAYDKYLADLASLGLIEISDGIYDIPSEKIDEYNAITEEYQAAVAEFNAYWDERILEIEEYNAASEAYNERVYILELQLNAFAKEHGLRPMSIPRAETRNVSIYTDIKAPDTIDFSVDEGMGVMIKLPPFPSYPIDIVNLGSPSVKYDYYVLPSAETLSWDINNDNYEETVLVYDTLIQENINRWAFWIDSAQETRRNTSYETILNEKPLLSLLFGEENSTRIENQKSLEENQKIEKKELIDELIDFHSKKILGNEILQEIIQETDPHLAPEQVEKIANQLSLLSLGLLNHSSIEAIFPSLSLIGKSIASLPADSPAFALLFALSLTNRVEENVHSGITRMTLETLLSEIPELASLPEAALTKIVSALNMGLLLMVGKLLEVTLGLPGLFARILAMAAPSLKIDPILAKYFQEHVANEPQKLEEYKNHFIAQGFSPEKSKFLSEVSLQILNQGILAPQATVISPQKVNLPLVIDTLKAALILSDPQLPLEKADAIAHQAVADIFIETPTLSMKLFRHALDLNLQEWGINKNSREIVNQAVVFPLEEKRLSTPLTPAFTPEATMQPSTQASVQGKSTQPIESNFQTLPADSRPSPQVSPEFQPSQPIGSTTSFSPLPQAAPIQPIQQPTLEPASASPIPSTAPAAPLNIPSSMDRATPPVVPQDAIPSNLTIDLPFSETVESLPFIHSEIKLKEMIKERIYQLLVPQLGPQITKEIVEETNITLFGNPHPTSLIKTDSKLPPSLVNLIKEEIEFTNFVHEEAYGEKLAEAFEATIETSVDLAAFLTKLMNPAYLLLYSSQTGIIYSSNTKERQMII